MKKFRVSLVCKIIKNFYYLFFFIKKIKYLLKCKGRNACFAKVKSIKEELLNKLFDKNNSVFQPWILKSKKIKTFSLYIYKMVIFTTFYIFLKIKINASNTKAIINICFV